MPLYFFLSLRFFRQQFCNHRIIHAKRCRKLQLLFSYNNPHRSKHLIQLFRRHLVLLLYDLAELVLGLWPQLLKYGLSLLFFLIGLLVCILQPDLLFDLIVVLAHNVVHLLYDILGVWI